jgi:type IV secretion system protein VirB10
MNKDKLSPEESPNVLTTSGVKRVNKVPLLIGVGIVLIFSVLIASVAVKKSLEQRTSSEKIDIANEQANAFTLANEVIEIKNKIKPQPQAISLPPPPMLTQKIEPAANSEDASQLNNKVSVAEIERIRQEKTQAFEMAVKARLTVEVDREKLSPRTSSTVNNHQSLAISANESFKEQLQLLQQTQKLSESASTIGGHESESRWRLNAKVQSPRTPFVIRTGAVIPGVLISGIRSELNGQIIAQVSQNVYDSATGKYLLIPQGTKLFGLYSDEVKFGQDSLLVAWQRLEFPDGRVLDIGSMPGADNAGYAGFRDKVNHHYARIYGSSLLMSAIIAGVSYSQNKTQGTQTGTVAPSFSDVLSMSLGQQLGETTSQLIAKNINTAPTIDIRPGYEFNVMVTKDLVFGGPYRAFSY